MDTADTIAYIIAGILTVAIMAGAVALFGKFWGLTILLAILLTQQIIYRIRKGYWEKSDHYEG